MEDLPVVGWFHHNMLCFAPAKEDCMDSLSYHFVGDNDLPKWGVEISDLGHLYIFILWVQGTPWNVLILDAFSSMKGEFVRHSPSELLWGTLDVGDGGIV